MKLRPFFIGITVTLGIALHLVLRCATPIDPDTTQTRVEIILDSPTLTVDGDFLEDSLGNPIRIGIACFLPENLDSVNLRISTPTGETVLDTVFRPQSTLLYDTLWKTVLFLQPGAKNISVYPFSSVDLNPAKATLLIYNRELPHNAAPSITVAGARTVRPETPCTLIVKVKDADPLQTVQLKLEKHPDNSSIKDDSLFVWNIPVDYTGVDTVIISATDNGIPSAMSFDTVHITVTRNPHTPTLDVIGDRTLKTASNCVLTIAQADKDADQTVTTTVSGNPDNSSIIDGNVFMWQIPGGFTGNDTMYFTATDNGIPPKSIVDTVIIIVSEDDRNFAPEWTDDTLSFTITDAAALEVNLDEYCSDADGDEVSFTIADGAPDNDILEGARYRFTPAQDTDQLFIIPVLAKDKNGSSAEAVLNITVKPRVVDNKVPVITMINPATDSLSINSPVASITFSAIDESGIDTVVCSMDGSSFKVVKVDNYYTVIVSGLLKDVYNRIMISASDASDRHNSYSTILYLKYDPTMEDRTPPVIERITPVGDSTISAVSSAALSIVATDVSGITSVVGKMGETLLEVGRTDSLYTVQVNGLTKNAYERIVLLVTDASVNKNLDSVVYYVKYDPTLNDRTPPKISLKNPEKDSSTVVTNEVTVSVEVTDENGLADVVCLVNGRRIDGSGSNSVYTMTVAGLVPNQYNRIAIVATDASMHGNRDSVICYVKYDPTMGDVSPPVLARFSPVKDSSTVGTASVSVAILATDANGISSMECFLNGNSSAVSHADALYSATVAGLTPLVYNRVVFVATDASSNKNRDSIAFLVKYDPTMSDAEPPVLIRFSPARDSSVVASASIPFSITVTDANGIKSVTCTMSGRTFSVAQNGSIYSTVADGLLPNEYNRVVFTAEDASSQGNRDSIVYHVYSDPTMNDHTNPQLVRLTPDKDTVLVSVSAVQLTIIVTDASGIRQVLCSKEGIPLPVTLSGTNYSVTAMDLVRDVFTRIVFVATDKSSSSNSDSIVYHVKYDPTMTDNEKPTVNRAVPNTEAYTTAESPIMVSVNAFDASGIGLVTCTMDGTVFNVTRDGSTFTAEVDGLKENVVNLITFEVTDASSNKNLTSLSYRVTYDPSLADETPPVFTITNWPADNAVIRDSTKVLAFKVIDPSGIDSVWWDLNGTFQALLPSVAPDAYSFSAPLSHTQANRISIYATDNSTNHNRDSLVRTLYYNRQPVANSQLDPETKRNTPLSIRLTASDPDGDAITKWEITQYPVNGGITIPAALPNLIYATTNPNFEGKDSIKFKVWDARDSSAIPGVIIITIKANDIAPTFVLEPASANGDFGASITFTSRINNDVYPAPTYTWRSVTGEVVGTTGPDYIIPKLNYSNQGDYILEISNRVTTITSNRFTLTVNDRTPPVVKLVGSADTLLLLNNDWEDIGWVEPGASAYDDRDGDMTDKIVMTGEVNAHAVGVYSLYYAVTDSKGNNTTVERIVRVEGWEKIANFQSLDFTSIMTADNKYYVFYVSNNEQGRVSTLNEDNKFVQVGKDQGNVSALSIALGNDKVTPYISYYNPANASVTVMKLVNNEWQTVISQDLPIWYENSSTLSLTLGADLGAGDVPHVASKFQDGNYSNCGVYNINQREWTSVGDPKAFDGIINNSALYRDRNLVLLTALQNTPYIAGTANITGARPRPVCKKFDGKSWVSAAKDSLIGEVYLTNPNNIHLLRNSRDEIFFGSTFGEGTSDPRVYQLKGDVWSELPHFARNSNDGGGGFSMAMGSDDRLYAAHPENAENDDMIVKRWNGLEWRSIPDFNAIEPEPAFTAPNNGVSIAAGKDECYVTYLYIEDTGARTAYIMHWKKQ